MIINNYHYHIEHKDEYYSLCYGELNLTRRRKFEPPIWQPSDFRKQEIFQNSLQKIIANLSFDGDLP